MNLAEPSARARRNGLLKALRCDLKNRFSFLVLTGEVSWGCPSQSRAALGGLGKGLSSPVRARTRHGSERRGGVGNGGSLRGQAEAHSEEEPRPSETHQRAAV